MEVLEQFKSSQHFTRMFDSGTLYIETLEIEHESSGPIQTAITFNMDVRLSPMIYRDAPNLITEVLEKFKWL